MERAGRAGFLSAKCAGCHKILGEGGYVGPDLTEVGLRHSAAWLRGFIESPTRFHPESPMPAYGPPILSHEEVEAVAQYVSTLRGKAGPKAEPRYVDTFPETPKPE